MGLVQRWSTPVFKSQFETSLTWMPVQTHQVKVIGQASAEFDGMLRRYSSHLIQACWSRDVYKIFRTDEANSRLILCFITVDYKE